MKIVFHKVGWTNKMSVGDVFFGHHEMVTCMYIYI